MAGDLMKVLGRAMADERREAPAERLSVRGAARARFLTKSILACFGGREVIEYGVGGGS